VRDTWKRRRALAHVALGACLVSSAAAQEKEVLPPTGWRVKPFAIENPSEGLRFVLRGYMQADFRSFDDWTAADGHNPRADTFQWRRLWVGFAGEWRRLSCELDVAPAFDPTDRLKDAWVNLRFTNALQLRAGYMKLPVSREFLTSPAKGDFMERAAVVDGLAPYRDWGAMLRGEIGRFVEYQAGVFGGDGWTRVNREETTPAARLVLKPRPWLQLGGALSTGDVHASPPGSASVPEPMGLSGHGVTGHLFFAPVFVDGSRLRWDADARFQTGPVSVWGELLQAREQRKGQGLSVEDLPDVLEEGWSVSATWLVTGEKKAATMRPDRSLFGGPGAVELALRFERFHFDDVANQGPESTGPRAANIRPAGYGAFQAGLSWWPSSFLRVMGDLVVERYDDALRAPEPGRSGNYVSLLGRLQVHVP
jgi:phosphate-selective porin